MRTLQILPRIPSFLSLLWAGNPQDTPMTPAPPPVEATVIEEPQAKARVLSDFQERRLKAIAAIFGGDGNKAIDEITSMESLPSTGKAEEIKFNFYRPEHKRLESIGQLFTDYNGRTTTFSSSMHFNIGVFVVNLLNDNEYKIKGEDVMGFINGILQCRVWNMYQGIVHPHADTGICF